MAAEPVTIAVVVPTLNETKALVQCVRSLLARDDLDEIVIVDASRADQVASTYLAHPEWLNKTDTGLLCVGSCEAGRSAQMNLGAGLTRADVILFLHADSDLPTVNLKQLLAPAATAMLWGRFDIKIDNPGLWAKIVGGMMNLRSRITSIATGDQGIFVSRSLWSKSNGFAQIPLMEDIDLCRRLKKTSRPMNLKQSIRTSARRWEQGGVLATIVKMWRFRFLYWIGVPAEKLARDYRAVR